MTVDLSDIDARIAFSDIWTSAMELPVSIFAERVSTDGAPMYWDTAAVHAELTESGHEQTQRSTERLLEKQLPASLKLDEIRDEHDRPLIGLVAACAPGHGNGRLCTA